jgi:hypothetical protein
LYKIEQPVTSKDPTRKSHASSLGNESRPLGAAGGGVALAIVGFIWGGWTTTSMANKLADERADSAVVAVLAPICVEKFQQSWRCEMEPRSADKNLFAGNRAIL